MAIFFMLVGARGQAPPRRGRAVEPVYSRAAGDRGIGRNDRPSACLRRLQLGNPQALQGWPSRPRRTLPFALGVLARY